MSSIYKSSPLHILSQSAFQECRALFQYALLNLFGHYLEELQATTQMSKSVELVIKTM